MHRARQEMKDTFSAVRDFNQVVVLPSEKASRVKIAVIRGGRIVSFREMETAMLDFVDYKYDVLVATTIIENGIDIPRANTIIINRADKFDDRVYLDPTAKVDPSSRVIGPVWIGSGRTIGPDKASKADVGRSGTRRRIDKAKDHMTFAIQRALVNDFAVGVRDKLPLANVLKT